MANKKLTLLFCIFLTACGGSGGGQEPQVQQPERSWTSSEAPWLPRDGAGLLALGDHLYMLGGWLHGPLTSEVWRTSDLKTWELIAIAPWAPRHGAAWLVHDNRLWVIGGDLYTDVWSSPNGMDWTLETESAPFGPRYAPNSASLNGEIYVYAGQHWTPTEWFGTAVGYRDVWKSPNGRNWTLVTEQVPWSERALIHGSAVKNGYIYMIGGGLKQITDPLNPASETLVERSDVWRTLDGVVWEKVTDNFGIQPRTHFSVTATESGCWVSDGSVGKQTNISAELYFAQDCAHFTAVDLPVGFLPRHASSMVEFKGQLVIAAGLNAGQTVWSTKLQ